MASPSTRALRSAAALVLALASTAAAGCGAETGRPGEGETHLELGSGSWRFEPLEDGQAVDLVRGAQGGWHIWISVRAEGFAESQAVLELETQVADESRPPQHTEVEVRLERPDAEGRRAFIGWPAILAEPGCLMGEMLRVTATLRDDAGTRVEAERYVTVMGGDDPPTACE